ncbi:MAG: hypothetical protein IT562_22825 [Alphaproteobacteria bacterium]|nr:hypothetical protein [Alphaproteobacteria bacterium]
MNKIKTFTLASLLGLAGFAGGFATEATAGIVVNDKQGSDGAIIAVLNPADQGAEHPGDAAGRKAGGLASLKGIGSTNNLFSNSKGGDQGNALLLPAVQKVREAARGEADGSVKPGDAQGLNFTNSGDTKGLNFSNPGAAKGLNFTNNANNAVGGTGAPKSLNFTATARK